MDATSPNPQTPGENAPARVGCAVCARRLDADLEARQIPGTHEVRCVACAAEWAMKLLVEQPSAYYATRDVAVAILRDFADDCARENNRLANIALHAAPGPCRFCGRTNTRRNGAYCFPACPPRPEDDDEVRQ